MSEENQYVPPAVWKWNQDAVKRPRQLAFVRHVAASFPTGPSTTPCRWHESTSR